MGFKERQDEENEAFRSLCLVQLTFDKKRCALLALAFFICSQKNRVIKLSFLLSLWRLLDEAITSDLSKSIRPLRISGNKVEFSTIEYRCTYVKFMKRLLFLRFAKNGS